MIERIISGGQTGADRAGLDAAMACGVPHGGWCPLGRRSEDGVIPDCYQLWETSSSSYLVRTEKNVEISHGTLIFTHGELKGGSARTAHFAGSHQRPCLHLRLDLTGVAAAVESVRAFVSDHQITVLNVAGSRGSSEPGIHAKVMAILVQVLDSRKSAGTA